MNKIISKGIDFCYAVALLISFVLVGTPLKENMLLYSLCIIAVGIGYVIYKIIKKEKVINGILDIAVMLLYLSPLIPILFDTYGSLEDSVRALIKNVSLFVIYIMVKDRLNKDDLGTEKITNIILAGLMLLVLFGFDEIMSRTLFRYMKYIGIPNVVNYEERMFSTLCYANTFAILMAVGIFISLNKVKNSKPLFSSIIYVFLTALLLTYSRSVIALFILTFGIYLVFSKDRVYETIITLVNFVLALLSMKLFNIFMEGEVYIFVWLGLIGIAGISYIISTKLECVKEKFNKIKLKNCIYLFIAMVVLTVLVYVVGIQLTVPLNLFANGKSSDFVRYKLYKIEADTEYNIELDIESSTLGKYDGTYTIEVAEENKYYDTIEEHSVTFGKFSGTQTIQFKTSKDTVALVLFFRSNNEKLQDGMKINELRINGKKQGLNYLYLPANLVEKVESFTLKNKSLWERFVYFKDGLKIAKEHPLAGNGAKGWLYNYANVQSYVYTAVEPHSYIIQQLIDNGIIAILMLVVIAVYLVYIIIKRKSLTLLDMSFILLNVHSILDFNMSFYVVCVIWILLLVVITLNKENNKENIKNIKSVNYLKIIVNGCVLTTLVLVIVLGGLVHQFELENEEIANSAKEYIKQGKYDVAILNIQKIDRDKKYSNMLYDISYKLDYSKLNKQSLEYIYNKIINEKIIANSGYNLMLNRIVNDILHQTEVEDYRVKFANHIINNNENIIKNIKDNNSNRLEENVIQMLLTEQENIYENAKNML